MNRHPQNRKQLSSGFSNRNCHNVICVVVLWDGSLLSFVFFSFVFTSFEVNDPECVRREKVGFCL